MKKRNVQRTLMTMIAAVTLLSFGFSNSAIAQVASDSTTATINIPDVCGVDVETVLTNLDFGTAAQNDIIERLLVIENLGTATSTSVTIAGDPLGWQRVSPPNTSHIAVGNTSFDDNQLNNHVAFTGTAQPIADLPPGGVDRNIDIEVNVQLINLPAGGDLQFIIDLEVGACSS